MRLAKNKSKDSNENKPQPHEVYLIMDNIRSIHNVGAIFRTAEASGVKKVYLCGITGYPDNKSIKKIDKVNIDNPISLDEKGNVSIRYSPSDECFRESLVKRIEKTALMATLNIDWKYYASIADLIHELRKENVYIVALEQTKESSQYHTFDYSKHTKIAFILGNEVTGVDESVLKICDCALEIPMMGLGKSLNVATSAGILLYRALTYKKDT